MPKYYFQMDEIWPHYVLTQTDSKFTDGHIELSEKEFADYINAYNEYETQRRSIEKRINEERHA